MLWSHLHICKSTIYLYICVHAFTMPSLLLRRSFIRRSKACTWGHFNWGSKYIHYLGLSCGFSYHWSLSYPWPWPWPCYLAASLTATRHRPEPPCHPPRRSKPSRSTSILHWPKMEIGMLSVDGVQLQIYLLLQAVESATRVRGRVSLVDRYTLLQGSAKQIANCSFANNHFVYAECPTFNSILMGSTLGCSTCFLIQKLLTFASESCMYIVEFKMRYCQSY